MGYNTQYTLSWEVENFELPLDFQEKTNLTKEERFSTYQSWNSHEDDMKKLSLLYPEIVFTLHGVGDEFEDIWYKYFKNGKMQETRATFVYDNYDEAKLK